jgi:hypothetical protein
MLVVPTEVVHLMTPFAPLFTTRVWPHVHVLLVGALRSPGQRTLTAVLRVMGLAQAPSVQPAHRVVHREVWSGREGPKPNKCAMKGNKHGWTLGDESE